MARTKALHEPAEREESIPTPAMPVRASAPLAPPPPPPPAAPASPPTDGEVIMRVTSGTVNCDGRILKVGDTFVAPNEKQAAKLVAAGTCERA